MTEYLPELWPLLAMVAAFVIVANSFLPLFVSLLLATGVSKFLPEDVFQVPGIDQFLGCED